MPRNISYFDRPERFVAGTVGEPGERAFYLQATDGSRVVSVALEKEQVRLLGEQLDRMLDEVHRRGGGVPPAEAAAVDDLAPLDQPVVEEFRVGTLALAWEPDEEVVVIEAQAITDAEPDEDAEPLSDDADGPDTLRVRLSPLAARGFAKRAARVVAAGRPPCPFCGLPIDPEGHVCPRSNGHRH